MAKTTKQEKRAKLMVVNFKKGDTAFHHEHDLARKIHYAKGVGAGNSGTNTNPPTV